MAKIALIEKQPSKIKYEQYFDFDFDKYQLCSDPSVKRILKRDTDIDIDTEEYDWLVLVGSEPVKHFTTVSSVTDYSGKKVDSKFLPVILMINLGDFECFFDKSINSKWTFLNL